MEAPIVIDAEANPPGPNDGGAAHVDDAVRYRNATTTTPDAEPAADRGFGTVPKPPAVDKVVPINRAAQLTPAETKAKAMQPLPQPPKRAIDPASLRVNGVFIGSIDGIDDNRSTTEKYLEWAAHGGGRWGPP